MFAAEEIILYEIAKTLKAVNYKIGFLTLTEVFLYFFYITPFRDILLKIVCEMILHISLSTIGNDISNFET